MTKRASALFAAALLGAAGCSGGSKGDTGPAGPPGPGGGDVGPGGMGALTVHVTFDRVNSTSIPAALPAPGVYCFTNPDFTGNSSDTLAEAVSDANGNAVLSVPGGKYKVQCRPAAPGKAADYANDMPLTAEVAVAAGGSATVEVLANRTNPLYFTKTPKVSGARIATGGGKIDVGEVSVAGATITVTPVAKKSVVDVTVAGDNTFSVPDVDVVLAGLSATYGAGTPPLRTPGRGIWGAFELPEGLGFVGLGDGVARSMAKGLAFDVKATSGDSSTTVRVTGAIAGLQDIQGISTGPIGVMVIGSDTEAETYAWTLAGQTFKNVAIDPLPALNGAATRNPYFIPTVEGVYTLTNTASGHVLTFTAGTYTGLLAADGTGSACSQCHDDENGAGFYVKKIKHYASTADYFFHNMGVHGNHNYFSDPKSRDSQATTAATIFQWGLQGIDYAPTCYRCHTTGSFWTNSNGPAATVDNGGFQSRLEAIDAAAKTKDPNAVSLSKSWAGDGQDHWANLDGGLKAMAGIQCESCHGPASGHMAKGGDVARLAQPYAVGACAVCHDAPGHHDKVELWSKSGHGNAALAIEEGAGSASCARCHGAQGFKAYIDQLAKKGSDCASWQDSKGAAITLGADGTLPNRNLPWADQLYVHVGDKDANGQYVCKQAAAGADLASLGVDPATVQPQTCQACHEAHSTELRVEGDTSVLAVGFQVNGAGAGALCMTCHNGRNGPRGDNVAPPTAGIASSHTADQTEVLLGQNFYWVNGVVSKHAAVKDTCVGCHVQLHPDSVQTGNDNHTFEADETICKNCHGANVGPETLFAQYDAGIKALGQAMLKALGPSFTIVGKTSEVVVTTSNATITSYGRSGLSLVFATPIAAPDAATGTVTKYTVALNKLKDAGGTTGSLTGRLAKAGWNWSMLWNRSAAVHNPTLTFQVLTVSAQKVQDPAAGAL